MEDPSTIKLSKAKYEELSARPKEKKLLPEDYELLSGLLKVMLWMTLQLKAGKIGIARLKRLIFGGKTEAKRNLFPDKEEGTAPGRKLRPKSPMINSISPVTAATERMPTQMRI